MIVQKPYDELTADDAHTMVGPGEDRAWIESNRKFYDGDHWQGGEGIAEALPPPSHITYQTVKRGIARMFTSENHIKEVVNRRRDGVLGQPVRWRMVDRSAVEKASSPTEQESTALRELNASMREWYVQKHVHEALREFVRIGSLEDKAYLRIIIPSGRLRDAAKIDTIDEALDLIYVEALGRNEMTFVRDRLTNNKAGIFAYSDDPEAGPTDPIATGRSQKTAEICWVDLPSGMTVLRRVRSGMAALRGKGGSAPIIELEEVEIDLGRRMTMYEGTGMLLVDEPVRQQQRAVNTTLTHMLVDSRSSDFRQRIFLNAQPIGSIIKDPETGNETTVAATTVAGLDTDLFLRGVEEELADGSIRIKDAEVRTIEPGSAQRYRDGIATYRAGLYRDTHQLHIELSQLSTSTGDARQQAMSDFELDLKFMKGRVDGAGRWLLMTVYLLAQYLADQATDDSEFDVEFDSIITLGPVDPDTRRVLAEEVRLGTRSRRTAMAEANIEDPDAELSIIDGDEVFTANRREKQAEIIQKLVQSGASLEGAIRFAGVEDDAVIQDLIEMESDPEPPPTPTGPPDGDGGPGGPGLPPTVITPPTNEPSVN